MTFSRPATDPTYFGVTPAHWRVIADFAAHRRYVVALRAGKRAAVRWIEQRFPAKPLDLKIKVDDQLGLLVARTDDERAEAWQVGRPVLESLGAPSQGFVARLAGGRDAFPGAQFHAGPQPWAKAGVVIDPATRLPITSDYDLAAVVDTARFDYTGTYGSLAGGPNRTNVLVASVAEGLNRRFGSRRMVHGSQAQYDGSLPRDRRGPRLSSGRRRGGL